MAGLNVVALISGGKDSLFSILHCIANGHNVVALANLHPPPSQNARDAEDLDSFMYQTIGHQIMPLYEQALGLPLYRQEIVGSAVVRERSYQPVSDLQGLESDETESLVPLLLKVKAAHPELNAVSTGAILSDYQRTRVESVALRLGLVPLSYLWQYPLLSGNTSRSLLQDMAAVGQDSRIIKVASGGLNESFLWLNVADANTIRMLTTAAQRFGTTGDGAVLGEGGEYETLAVNGPTPLWKASISVPDEARTVVDNLYECRTGQGGDAAAQTRSIMDAMTAELEMQKPRLGMHSIAYTSIILRNMADFADVNRVYGSYFSKPNPPARVTLACADVLAHGCHLMIGFTCQKDATQITPIVRKGLHVQSRSYWAPANIGPYSQAISIPVVGNARLDSANVVYVAGQIPLVPANMELYHGFPSADIVSFAHQTVLALQHMRRIAEVTRMEHWIAAIAFIVVPPSETAPGFAAVASTAWESFHAAASEVHSPEQEDDDEDFDVWHLQQKAWYGKPISKASQRPKASTLTPPLWVIEVDALPRGASIEWVGYGATAPGLAAEHLMHLQYLLRTFKEHIIQRPDRVQQPCTVDRRATAGAQSGY
ncbi:hypothetical protein BAUCODRAFT_80130 [Baudoinia panamericana UAMH 10762]|uniref:Diphthine--ammonia ligase n=1 Tax=Baudoinia panamericana (strain UAMH 10762) TaxID=717646 RepID=M2M3Z1_BAUPA|nr:uncharacterized protein BAUCODRAFT_80130 [Baudoinia panamericana UAMH 10762]EMC91296.1 hypothetical protein BAUCODRAFT_80130 [Baudoinia panamericana UAMH 10762]